MSSDPIPLYTETCSCGAAVSIPSSSLPGPGELSTRRTLIADWRNNHRHPSPAVDPGPAEYMEVGSIGRVNELTRDGWELIGPPVWVDAGGDDRGWTYTLRRYTKVVGKDKAGA